MKVAFRALDHPGALPLITLAINNQVCDKSDFTPYQMVLGQAARLPRTLFFRDNDDTRSSLQPVAETHIFQENMRHLHHSARNQQITNSYVNGNLFIVEEVLVRDDGNKAPLSKLYAGLFGVILKTEKYFALLCPGWPLVGVFFYRQNDEIFYRNTTFQQ